MKSSVILSLALAALTSAVPPPGPAGPAKPPVKLCAKVNEECMDNKDCCSGRCGPRIAIYPPVPGKCEAAATSTFPTSAVGAATVTTTVYTGYTGYCPSARTFYYTTTITNCAPFASASS